MKGARDIRALPGLGTVTALFFATSRFWVFYDD